MLNKLKIDNSFIVVLIIMLLTKNKIYFLCILSIIAHELGHILILKLFKIQIKNITLSAFGFKCNIDNINNDFEMIIIYLAGPLVNLLMCLFGNRIIFIINMMLFSINMLPIYPLDGYNLMKIIIKLMLKDDQKIVKIINFTLIIIIYLASIYFLIKFKNYSLLLFIICVTIKNM